MKQNILILIVLVVVGVGVFAGLLGFLGGTRDSWSPRNYVAAPGDCFVPPQGDPLYDAHYAEHVNGPNCTALGAQSDSQYTDAMTNEVRWNTLRQNFYLIVFGFVFCSVFLIVIVLSLKR